MTEIFQWPKCLSKKNSCHQWSLANCDWMPASYTSRLSSYPCGHPRHAMEPGHLLHSVLTCPPGGNSPHLKSRQICIRCTTTR